MSENLKLWEAVRKVPDTAQKAIGGGRLKGMTDINPVWRMKTLTEQFGPVGLGWWYVIKNKWLDTGADGEIAAWVEIDLYYMKDGQDSHPIPGLGGSMFIANEKNGPYTSDEAYKMALTDAISVACKPLGVGADVYWEKDATKYTRQSDEPQRPAQQTNTTAPQSNESVAVDAVTVKGAAAMNMVGGKHEGMLLGEIYKKHQDYAIWYMDKGFNKDIKTAFTTLHNAAQEALAKQAKEKAAKAAPAQEGFTVQEEPQYKQGDPEGLLPF